MELLPTYVLLLPAYYLLPTTYTYYLFTVYLGVEEGEVEFLL